MKIRKPNLVQIQVQVTIISDVITSHIALNSQQQCKN